MSRGDAGASLQRVQGELSHAYLVCVDGKPESLGICAYRVDVQSFVCSSRVSLLGFDLESLLPPKRDTMDGLQTFMNVSLSL